MKKKFKVLRLIGLIGLFALFLAASVQSATAGTPPVEINVKKTVDPFLKRTWEWSIEKTVGPAMHEFVEGFIVVAYQSPVPVTISSLVDVVEGGYVADVVCPVSFPHEIPTDPDNVINKIKCTYSVSLADGATRVNTATAVVDGIEYSGSETVDFTNAPIVEEGFGAINVDDTNGLSWWADQTTTWLYDREFTCPTDDTLYVDGMYTYTHPNTATIIETGQYDDALVTVKCRKPPEDSPGTGTPGYWMNHPEAWPVEVITIGGTPYTKADAIDLMKAPVKKDKTFTMFPALVAAKLNVLIGNEDSCVAGTIAAADAWMSDHAVGSGVKGSSEAWKIGEPLYWTLDAYNNGLLCAPSRDLFD